MKRLNDYFLNVEQKKEKKQWISLCGKLEAIIGNYFLSGAGTPEEEVEILYYDSKAGEYDMISLVKENVVAYILENETIAFVLMDMLTKFKEDTKEYELVYIPAESFETEEIYIDREMELPRFLESVIWIEDDFMYDDSIEFDCDAFDVIDSGEKYVNPNHFSVKELMNVLRG